MNLGIVKCEKLLLDRNVPGPVLFALGTVFVCTLVVCGHSLHLLRIMVLNKGTVNTLDLPCSAVKGKCFRLVAFILLSLFFVKILYIH